MSSKDKELSKSKFKTFIKNAKNPAGGFSDSFGYNIKLTKLNFRQAAAKDL